MRRWQVVLAAALVGMPMVAACSGNTHQDSMVSPLVAQADAVPTPRLDWVACQEPELSRYQCATAALPVDYAKPQGATFSLALVRQRAADPERRIGTLFTAAGGPGGSGIDWARRGPIFPGPIADRFDVVTFDQRGIGRSAQVRCFPNADAQQRFWADMVLPPVDAAQEAVAERAAREWAAGCGANGGELLAHLTTVDAARDLDLLRRAVGDPRLTYQGGSYASYLGQVYGALFGDRVRALQLTAVLDPELYTNDAVAETVAAARGTEEVLSEFLRHCAQAGPQRCAFAPAGPVADDPAAALRQRNSAVLQRLREAPITVGRDGAARQVTYTELMPLHANLLYDPRQGWPALAALLAELERGPDGDPATVAAVLDSGAFGLDFLDSFIAISCADNGFPKQPGNWPALAGQAAAAAPTYGPFWLYLKQACAAWPSPPQGYPQRYTGPWQLRSDTPALLLNNRFDPVTNVGFAQQAERLLGNARLLVVEGHGHEVVSACASVFAERYLIDLQLPAPGTTCVPDRAPFAQ